MIGACAVAAACLVSACSSLPEGGNGASCERSAQCAAGLVCVSHVCSGDLSMIGDQSMVPDFGTNADAAALGDAELPRDAASSGSSDAGPGSTLDASNGVDAALPGMPMPDSGGGGSEDDAG